MKRVIDGVQKKSPTVLNLTPVSQRSISTIGSNLKQKAVRVWRSGSRSMKTFSKTVTSVGVKKNER